ncbi:MAG: SMI1/KNR4 family protein [Nocardiopsaceae bacterium]|nr:SMI1/KNR4 family protein [Nocardiopsaceae bacterium]
MTVTWVGVRQRLERLREGYAGGHPGGIFGADGHQFEIVPQLSEADLAEAEAQFGVQLPEEYRGFLLAVSGGGAGPYYGLFPFSRDADGRWGWLGDGAELTDRSALGTTFEPGDISAILARLEATQPPPEDEEAYEDWLNRYENVLWADHRTRGAACVCHEGCAYRDWLIITGPRRGQMWRDDRAGDTDLAPGVAADGSALTFGRWYLNWLSEAEETVFKTRSEA